MTVIIAETKDDYYLAI